MSRDSTVGMATGYGLDGRGSILVRGRDFLFFTVSRRALWPTQPPIQWVSGALYPEVKQSVREADHSHLSSSEVKNDRTIHPLANSHRVVLN
jgi:hypothetical protein